MMDRVKELKNVSLFPIDVKQSGGLTTSVPPKGVLKDVKVTNLDEIREHAVVTLDLTEVKFKESRSRQRLYD